MSEEDNKKSIISFSRGSFRPSFLGSSVCAALHRMGSVIGLGDDSNSDSDFDDKRDRVRDKNTKNSESESESGEQGVDMTVMDTSTTRSANQDRSEGTSPKRLPAQIPDSSNLEDLIFEFVSEKLASDPDSTNMSLKAWVAVINDGLNLSFNINTNPELYAFVKRTIFDQAEMYCSQSQSQTQSQYEIDLNLQQQELGNHLVVNNKGDIDPDDDRVPLMDRANLDSNRRGEPFADDSDGESLTDQFVRKKKRNNKDKKKSMKSSRKSKTVNADAYMEISDEKKTTTLAATGAVDEDELSSVQSESSSDSDSSSDGSSSSSTSSKSRSTGRKKKTSSEKKATNVVKVSSAEEELRVQKAIESGNLKSLIPTAEYMR